MRGSGRKAKRARVKRSARAAVDPIEAAAGAFAGVVPDLDLAKIRREEREAEREAEERKFGL